MTSSYQRSIGFLVLAAAVGLCASSAAAQWHYYYFKEKVPLPLDNTRVAVHLVVGNDTRAALSSLSKYGLDDESVEPTVLSGWYFVQIASSSTTVGAVEQLVRQASSDDGVEFVSPVFVGEYGPLAVTPTLLVGFQAHISNAQAEAVLAELRAGEILDRNWSRMNGVYRLRSASRDGFEVLAMANRLAERPEVKFAEPDMLITGTTDLTPNDPWFTDPGAWGLHNTAQIGSACPDSPAGTVDMDMDAPEAWEVTTGDPSVVVVIMDTGVQQDHFDLNQIPGMDFTGAGTGGGPLNECDGHGTLVAGCVSAILNNGVGSVGVAPSCKVASAKWGVSVVPCNGSFGALLSWLIDALDWAQTIGARVTNSSFGMGASPAITTKFGETHDAGVIHFAAAGNGGTGSIGYPASILKVQAVAALQRNGNLANFSQYGIGLQFSAPGCSIFTTAVGELGGSFATVNGTSFATPYTCGVAALVLSADPTLTVIDVLTIMRTTAFDLGDPGYDTHFGWGFVNAHQAVLASQRPVQSCVLDELVAAETTDGDRFGTAVSLDGDVMVMGALLVDDVGADDAGAAYVFRFNGDQWIEEAELTADDGVIDDEFGNAVAISNDVAIVGAHRVDDGDSNSGAAYIFRWDGAAWEQEQKLTAPDAAANDFFGAAVAIEGNWAIVGAFIADCEDASLDCGAVYTYQFNGTSWTLAEKLIGSTTSSGDLFGRAVIVRDGVLLVGAPNADCDAGADCGRVHVFLHGAEGWSELDPLVASDPLASDFFGSSLALSDDLAVVGAVGVDCLDDSGDCGAAYVFRRTEGSWSEEQKLHARDEHAGDGFGQAVGVGGAAVVVGATGDDCGVGAVSCGAAYVFRSNGFDWLEEAKLGPPGAEGDERFGGSLSAQDGIVVVGAAKVGCTGGSNCGAAFLFSITGDCNANGLNDTCDLLSGVGSDIDDDGVLDECVCPAILTPTAGDRGIKNRYLSFFIERTNGSMAVRVRFTDLPAPYDLWNGAELWAGPPIEVSENGASVEPIPAFENFVAAKLQCEPFFAAWGEHDIVHLFHEGVVPQGSYQIDLIAEGCPLALEEGYSPPLDIVASRWGDTVKDCSAFPCLPPDGLLNILDVSAVIGRFISEPGAIIKTRADLEPACVDLVVNISDAMRALGGFQGLAYPFTPSASDPCDSICLGP